MLFLLIVPSAIIGPEFNWECLQTWCQRMVKPFVVEGATSPQEVNQSLFGVLTRLLTEMMPGRGRYQVHLDLNLASLPPWLVGYLIKAVAFGLAGDCWRVCAGRRPRIGATRGFWARWPWWF